MAIADELLAFSATRSAWQQDLLRRAFTQPELSGVDLDETLAMLKAHVGVEDAGTAPEPLAEHHVPHRPAAGAVTVLLSVSDVMNVNQIAGDQTLPFAPKGITVVYGDNGSGKTGYVRVLKSACRSRRPDRGEIILGNVYKPPAFAPAEATIRFVSGNNEPQVFRWRDGKPSAPELSRISVFDSVTAPIYADRQSEIEFLPAGLDVLSRVGAACEALAARLDAEMTALYGNVIAPLTALPPNTDQSKLSARLVPETSLANLPSADDIVSAAHWDESHAERLKATEAELKIDPLVARQKCIRSKSNLEAVVQAIERAETALSDAAVAKLKASVDAARHARGAADLAASEQFKAEPLSHGVGGEPWRTMFAYARRFFAEAMPGVAFPVDAADQPCPLCQQPISGEAHSRLCRFHAFIEDAARREAERLEAEARANARAIETLQMLAPEQAAMELGEFGALGQNEKNLADRLIAELEALAARRRAILDAFNNGGPFDAMPELKIVPHTDTKAYLAALVDAAAAYERAATDPTEREQKLEIQRNLAARKAMADNLPLFLGRREQLVKLQKLIACKSETDTRPISLKNTDMRDRHITQAFGRRIRAELEALGLGYLPVKVDGRSDKGRNYLGPALEKIVRAQTSNILSEGEFRGLALACFLAEVTGIDGHDGVILDDPVSSFDHLHTQLVAARLVREAQTRGQVIIFTHDLAFYYELWFAAHDAGVSIARHWVRHTQQHGFGTVRVEDAPWEAKDVRTRLHELNMKLAAIRKMPSTDDDDYRRAATDFYTALRETWERLVEEKLFNGVTGRFQPGIQTQRLRGVEISDPDHQRVWNAMRRTSENSGHDRASGRGRAAPSLDQMQHDLDDLRAYEQDLRKRIEDVDHRRRAKEGPPRPEAAAH